MKQILDDVYNGKYKDVVTDDLGVSMIAVTLVSIRT